MSPRLGKRVQQARLSSRWLAQRGVVVTVFSSVALALAGPIAAALTLLLGAVCLYLYVSFRARANRLAIDRDLPALLTSVASSVRAGMDPLSALIGAREYFPKDTVLVQEIEKIRQGVHDGRDEEELLDGFLSLYESRDGELFKGCLILSRRHGGSLADPLHRITRVVRQRQSFRRKTKAALAMHRMSAIGIALCAVAMGALQFGMNPQSLDVAFHHPMGSRILCGGLLLISTGLGWMLTMGSEAKLQ
jgi:Flp pilus assembly protein TadB